MTPEQERDEQLESSLDKLQTDAFNRGFKLGFLLPFLGLLIVLIWRIVYA